MACDGLLFQAAKQFRAPLACPLLLLSPVRRSRAQRLSSTTVYPSHRRVAHKPIAVFLGGGATDTLLNVSRHQQCPPTKPSVTSARIGPRFPIRSTATRCLM